MWRNCQYLPQCTWPFGKTFTSSAGCKMEKKNSDIKALKSSYQSGAFSNKTNDDKNRAHCLFILDQDLKIVTD